MLSLYFYYLNIFSWDLFSFAFFFSYTFPGALWGEQSLTIAGSSLNLAESCPFQFTHLQNGNNNKHLRENIHMSSLKPLMIGSPEAQQREIASNSDDSNGFLMEPDSLCCWETKFSAQAPLHQSQTLSILFPTSSWNHLQAQLSTIEQYLINSVVFYYAKRSRLQNEDHAYPRWSVRENGLVFQQHFTCIKLG